MMPNRISVSDHYAGACACRAFTAGERHKERGKRRPLGGSVVVATEHSLLTEHSCALADSATTNSPINFFVE